MPDRLPRQFTDGLRSILTDSTYNFSEKAIIVLNMSFVIIGSEIDISVACIIALSVVVMGFATANGLDTWATITITIGLVTGTLARTINGLLITRLELPSIKGVLDMEKTAFTMKLNPGQKKEYIH